MFTHYDKSIKDLLGYDDIEAVTGDDGRLYRTAGGNYPSITTVLKQLSEESIAKWRARVGEEEANKISYIATQRGEDVHAIIEKYINNDADYLMKEPGLPYMPHIVESLDVLKPTLEQRIGTVYAQEVPLYSDHLKVAGRVDCVAEFDGKLSIVDFKTSKKWKKREWIEAYFMQEAAYAIMWEERTSMPITQLVTLIAVDFEQEPQIVIENRDDWTAPLLDLIDSHYAKTPNTLF